MIKVLLVDDEKMALNYLQNLISWEYYDFELVGAVTDTQKALTLFKKFRPDLVITDVKMPGMNGLELVGEIREIDNKVHILFLSSYKNFDYAKTAIRLGSDDYLIKSDLDEESFLKKMLNLKEEITRENQKRKYTLNVILEELFQKETKEDNYKKFLDENEYIRLHKKYNYLIFAKKDVPSFIEELIPQNHVGEEIYEYEIENECNRCAEMNKMKVVAFFSINKHELLAIIESESTPVSMKETEEKFYYLSKLLYDSICKDKRGDYFIYYCAERMSARIFGRFYREHKSFLMQRYVKNSIQILEFKIMPEIGEIAKKIDSVTADTIYNSIKKDIQQDINLYMENIKIAIEEEDYMTYWWYAQNLLNALKRFDDELIGEKSRRRFSLNEGNIAYELNNPSDVVAFIELKLEEVLILSRENRNIAYSDIIIKAMNYIQEHYPEDNLSAIDIAKAVGLSSSWLSTKFKEEVGIGSAEYINSVRIEEAKKKFDEGDYMIYEVSEKVGFTSSQYFSKIFKEYTGFTPNQYKRKKKDV